MVNNCSQRKRSLLWSALERDVFLSRLWVCGPALSCPQDGIILPHSEHLKQLTKIARDYCSCTGLNTQRGHKWARTVSLFQRHWTNLCCILGSDLGHKAKPLRRKFLKPHSPFQSQDQKPGTLLLVSCQHSKWGKIPILELQESKLSEAKVLSFPTPPHCWYPPVSGPELVTLWVSGYPTNTCWKNKRNALRDLLRKITVTLTLDTGRRITPWEALVHIFLHIRVSNLVTFLWLPWKC